MHNPLAFEMPMWLLGALLFTMLALFGALALIWAKRKYSEVSTAKTIAGLALGFIVGAVLLWALHNIPGASLIVLAVSLCGILVVMAMNASKQSGSKSSKYNREDT